MYIACLHYIFFRVQLVLARKNEVKRENENIQCSAFSLLLLLDFQAVVTYIYGPIFFSSEKKMLEKKCVHGAVCEVGCIIDLVSFFSLWLALQFFLFSPRFSNTGMAKKYRHIVSLSLSLSFVCSNMRKIGEDGNCSFFLILSHSPQKKILLVEKWIFFKCSLLQVENVDFFL